MVSQRSMARVPWRRGKPSANEAVDFMARVATDGGVTEAQSCLEDRIERLKSIGIWQKASAVWLPHGYKEGKLYAAKGGAGADLGFTRSGTKSRKGPTYVEQVPYNLLSRSEELDHVNWTKTNVTITADQDVDPITGQTTVDLCDTTGAAVDLYQSVTNVAPSSTYTFSFYAKRGTATDARYRIYDIATTGNLVASTSYYSQINSTGYSRVTVTFTTNASTTSGVRVYLLSTIGALGTIYIGKAQLVVGSEARDYFATTDRFNVPSLEYTNDTCPALSPEPARTNLILRSDQLNVAPWTTREITIVGEAIVGPDGLSTVEKLIPTSVSDNHFISQSSLSINTGVDYAFSCYAKAGDANRYLSLAGAGIAAANEAPVYDLFNGTVDLGPTTTIVKSASIEEVLDINGNSTGWYRCICIFRVSAASNNVAFCVINSATANDNPIYAGDNVSGLYVVGAQLEQSSYATSYIPTTSATVSRIADAVPALLPKGTNQVLHSEGFDNAAWVKTNLTPTSNDTNAPNGTLTADKLLETITNGGHNLGQSVTKPASTLKYTFSVSVKPIGRDWVLLSCNNAGGSTVGKWFNITSGSAGDDYSVVGSEFYLQNHSITAEANGFYRISITIKSDTSTTVRGQVNVSPDGSTISYAGDVTKGFYVWGAQLEQGDEATTYVATTTAPVHNGTVIGQTEGTIYFEGSSFADSTHKLIGISDGTINNILNIGFLNTNVLRFSAVTGGVVQASITNAGFTSGTKYKMAATWQNGKGAFFVDGVKIGEDLIFTVPPCHQINLADQGNGSNMFYGSGDGWVILPTALTDAEAILATTP